MPMVGHLLGVLTFMGVKPEEKELAPGFISSFQSIFLPVEYCILIILIYIISVDEKNEYLLIKMMTKISAADLNKL